MCKTTHLTFFNFHRRHCPSLLQGCQTTLKFDTDRCQIITKNVELSREYEVPKMFRYLLLLAILCISDAFMMKTARLSSRFMSSSASSLRMAVTEVNSIPDLDTIVSANPDKLVVVDYSTTWCGPCKLVLPKYIELSDKYPNVTFLKCIGDASTEASALMKREGVRSVPTFHLWKGGSRIDVVNGARIEEVEAAVTNNM